MILKEFAVDPAVMADFYRCAYVLDQMGFSFGRMMSGFPTWSEWKGLVKKACREADVPDVAKKRIMHRVMRAKRKFVPTDRLYRKQLEWIPNVRAQYPGRPFGAVVTLRDEDGIDSCLVVGEFFEDHEDWDVPRGDAIDRNAAAIARVVGPLVLHSREVVFVDPYFDPSLSEWQKPLAAVLSEATRGGRVLRRCEFHLKLQKDRQGVVYDNPTFERICRQHLPAVLPPGVELTLIRWEQISGGEKLHPRYILTEIGGIAFEVGLDEGKPGESTDVAILEPAILERRRAEYQMDNSPFRRVQEPIVVVGDNTGQASGS